MTTCGHVKTSEYGSVTLTCNLEKDHEGDHGIRRSPHEPPYVRWPNAGVELLGGLR